MWVARACLIVLVVSLNVGCLTNELWRDANETTLTIDKLAAVTTDDSGHQVLLFSYRRENGSVAFLTVPLTPDLRPIEPFQFKGPQRQFDSELGLLVSQSQIDQVLSAALSLHTHKLTATEAASVRDNPPQMYDSYGRSCAPLIAIAYRPLPDGKIERLNFAGRSNDSASQVPADSIIVLVPDKTPRPANEVVGARARAVIFTPLSVIIDTAVVVVAAPVGLILFFKYGPAI